MKQINVLITGVGGNIGQGIIKACRMSSLDLRLIGVDINPKSAGFYMSDKYYIVPNCGSINFISEIVKICNNENIDIIFIAPPIELPIFAKNKDYIENNTKAKVIINKSDVIDITRDKFLTAVWLNLNGFNYPKTILRTSLNYEIEIKNLIDEVGFPLIIKPRYGRGSEGIHKVKNQDELDAFLKLRDDYIIQECLKPEDEEYTSEVLILNNFIDAITMKRELLEGTTYRAKIDYYPELNEELKKIALKLNSYGSCNFQFILTKKELTIFEINARFSGTTSIRAHYGFNSPDIIIRKLLLNENVKSPINYRVGNVLRYWQEIYV